MLTPNAEAQNANRNLQKEILFTLTMQSTPVAETCVWDITGSMNGRNFYLLLTFLIVWSDDNVAIKSKKEVMVTKETTIKTTKGHNLTFK